METGFVKIDDVKRLIDTVYNSFFYKNTYCETMYNKIKKRLDENIRRYSFPLDSNTPTSTSNGISW